MSNLKRKLQIVLALGLCLSLAACAQAQVLTDLDIAAAAIAAVAAVPGIPATYVTYLSSTATALDCASAAVQKGGTKAQVALAISACGLVAVAPSVPAGTPTTVVAAINAVVVAVQKIIADQTQMTAAMVQTGVLVPMASGFAGGPNGGKKFVLGHGGSKKLARIRKTLQDAKDKLAKK